MGFFRACDKGIFIRRQGFQRGLLQPTLQHGLLPKEGHYETTTNLGLKPRRLRGHDPVLTAHLNKLLNRNRSEGDSQIMTPRVDLRLQIARVPISSNERQLFRTRILNSQNTGKYMPLNDIGVDCLSRVRGVIRSRSRRELKPASLYVDSDLMNPPGLVDRGL